MTLIVEDMGVDTVEDVTAVEDGAPNVVANNEVSTILSAAPRPRATVPDPDPNLPACLALKYYTYFAPVLAFPFCDFDILQSITHVLFVYAYYPAFFVIWCIGIPPGVPAPSLLYLFTYCYV